MDIKLFLILATLVCLGQCMTSSEARIHRRTQGSRIPPDDLDGYHEWEWDHGVKYAGEWKWG